MKWQEATDVGKLKDTATVEAEATAVRAFWDALGFRDNSFSLDLTLQWLQGNGLYEPEPALLGTFFGLEESGGNATAISGNDPE
jgi:hypothetical protein